MYYLMNCKTSGKYMRKLPSNAIYTVKNLSTVPDR